MRFWDSSAIVPLLAPQSMTAAAETLLQADSQMLVWWGTSVECISALARLERDRSLSHADVAMAQARLRGLVDAWNEVQPHVRVRTTAERLLRVHPLRAADALQLAAALEVAGAEPSGTAFVCFDRRLCEAAARETLVVIDERIAK
jgi:uncharacterized protein